MILMLVALGSPRLILGQTASAPVVSVTQNLPGLARVQAINKSGEIAGQMAGTEEVQGVLIEQNGSTTPIVVPGAEQTLIYGMDNSTRIVGAYNLPDHGSAHGFLYDKGTYTTIDVPGGTDTRARSINDPKRIVGDFNGSDGKRHGFLYDKGSFTQIDFPGAVATYIYGLNNPGTMVGYYIDSQGHQHGFVFNNKAVTMDVPFPGATDTFLYGISNPGVIVGSYIDGTGTHAFVNVKGAFTSIDAPDTPPGVGTFGRSVNDNNQVLLYGATAHIAGIS
jgi:uncharacterized membrane protein